MACRSPYHGMKSTLRHLLIVPLLALASCDGREATRTGFLSPGYDKLQPTMEHPEDLVYVSPVYIPANYTKVVIDPVVWRPAEGTPQRDASVVKELQDDFAKSLSQALARKLAVVPAGSVDGPADGGVLRLHGAITSTRRANWYVNASLMLVGASLVNASGASVEIEVLDAGSSQPMMALATFNTSMPWNVLGYYQKFGDARRAFDIALELPAEQLAPKSEKTVAANGARQRN